PAGAAGQPGSADVAVRGVFQIEAYPDSNRLIVISKTEENFAYLDAVIEAMDVPLNPNVPILVELGYADAGEVADLLNALLAEAGTGDSLPAREEGLTGGGIEEGPVAGGGGGGDSGGTAGSQAGASTQAGQRRFPWQSGRPRDDQSPESPLLGRVRIVPVFRLNALAILAPPEMRDKIRELVVQYDKPGRQVMISAIIAEVELNDAFAFGLRVSSGTITPASTENTIGMTMGFEGSRDNLIPELFTTSVLDVSANVNLLLQALAQKTNVRVLQEPRIFTSDNEEAAFFDGQDVPFIDQSQTTDVGGITQSFSYQDVGVLLNVRPRITAQRDVDVELRLKLSNVVPGQTLFGGFILDRRETNTRVVVKDGQTIVISGILTDTESKVTRGVPFLMDIPLVGELFKSRDNSTIRTELIAFITPKVVEHPSLN
ncbi:MAG: type II secretion system protein GspD, partial [Myxococcota bacterium]